MTRQEALEAMLDGHKVTHQYFTPEEWATMNDKGMVVLEDGVVCSAAEFWRNRSNDCFDKGWSYFPEVTKEKKRFTIRGYRIWAHSYEDAVRDYARIENF
jgi:hypothetical protein